MLANGKNVLVTGGAGFVGSHVVDRAIREGFNVYVVDNLYTGTESNFAQHVGHPRFTFIKHDVQFPFPPTVESIKFDLIFHLASAASPVHYQNEPIDTTLTCVNGANNALRTAMRCDCPILIASTSEVYGDPLVHPQTEDYLGNVSCNGIRSCYDEGKRCAEALCFDYNRKHGVKIRVIRIFNTYGPRMCFNDGRIISNFMVQALKGQPITVYGKGDYTRSFQYCDDLVEGMWKMIHHPTETGPVNVGNPQEFTVLDMAKKIKELTKSTSEIVFLPATKDDPKQRKPDITKAKTVLGWEPKVSVADGLVRTKEDFSSRLSAQHTPFAKLYIQCNPLLDISAHVDESFLKQYGMAPASAALCTPEQLPIYQALEKVKGVAYIPGGSALNTARVAQWLSQAPKRSFVSYVGCIADDKYGSILKNSAEDDGVQMLVEFTKKAATGSCAVCVTGKERSLLANLAAANELSAAHLEKAHVASAMASAKLFYLSGFTLTLDVNYALTVAKQCAASGGTFMMNFSAPFIVQFFGEQLKKMFGYVDIVFSNDDEAKAFAETQKWETKDVKEIAILTAKLPKETSRPRTVVFTQGSNPTIYATAEGAHEVPVPPVPSDKIVDTNAAGDAFVGGFLAGAALGRDIVQCIKAGHYGAGVIIQHDGCTFPATPSFTLEQRAAG